MAFPVDAGRATTNSTTSGTSHNLNLPASIAAGDLLIAVVRAPDVTTIAWPAGWTEWETTAADASTDVQSIAFRIASGTEGATIAITFGTARIMVGIAYRITGAHAHGLVISAVAIGSASQPNSPSLTIPSAARDILWLSIGGSDDSVNLTSGPASYASATTQKSTATGGAGVTVYGASRQLNGQTQDPGAWTLSTTVTWMAWTVAVSDAPFPMRVTQVPTEALVSPTSGKARITQNPTEVLVAPSAGKARITQVPVEVLVLQATTLARVTQIPAEALVAPTNAKARITQEPVEVLVQTVTAHGWALFTYWTIGEP